MQQGRIAVPELDLMPKLGDLENLRSRQDERKGVAAAVLYSSSSRKVKPALSAVRTPCRIGTTEA